MNVKEALTAILSKSLSAEQVYSQVSPELRAEIEISLAYIGELHKAKQEEGAHPKIKAKIRADRAKQPGDKLADKERGDDHTLINEEHGLHWRKPKSGEKPVKYDKSATNDIRGTHLKNPSTHAVPEAGKAHVPTTGMTHDHAVTRATGMGPKARANEAAEAAKPKMSLVKEEVCKFDQNGQWKMEKAGSIDYAKMNAPKPKTESPSIDYAKMNAVQKKPEGPSMDYSTHNPKPDYKSIEEKAPSIDYKKMNDPANQKQAWKQKSTPATQKEAWMKVNRQRNEMAAAGFKKNDGVMLDDEIKDKGRMMIKDDMMQAGGSLEMSEKNVEGSPEHEATEKKLGKKIKKEAQDLLDMHKK